MIQILIPVISGLLYRAGGTDQWKWCPLKQKWWRWGMGAIIGLFFWSGIVNYLITIALYYIATAAFKYGDNSWLNFLPPKIKFAVCGFAYGAASVTRLGYWAILQAIIAAIGFYAIKTGDDKNEIKNPFVEFGRGLIGNL